MTSAHEAAFEAHIAGFLVEHGGYRRRKDGTSDGESHFDSVAGLDTADLFEFIGATQPGEWVRLVDAGYGGDEGLARAGFVQRLASQLDKRGTVDVLRHGVVDRNVRIRLAFFKPASGLAPELVDLYEANVLSVTRQLRYEPLSNKTIDLALSVNGVPVATAELKNPLTGQRVEHAILQYRKDRDPKNRTLRRVGMVHFAVDPYSVSMTTHLVGKHTRFLPFNQGHALGAGNPPNPDGHRTAYLWEQVWSRDTWMDILGRFIHVEKPSKGSKARPTVIFPRFHQWDAVRRLEADAKATGAGRNYLVQHSAGSGKSNSIAWLAHRFSSLHNATDQKVFDKVVVITDRVILDRQLQDTISQFEHAIGVVQRIDKSSSQLAEALVGEQARIIVTTLQKFPFLFDKISSLPDRTYAVIVDEAHSSQTGESAKALREMLGAAGVKVDENATDTETLLAKAVAARGRQPNLSFFAFTATPKGRTLELFGDLGADGKHHPFHLYAMRQAIEEGFIEDVLANYLTYNQYFKLEKTILDDPEYQTDKARRALARFIVLHPGEPGPEGRDRHRALPGQDRPPHEGQSESDGGLLVPAPCRPHVGVAPQAHQQQRLRPRGARSVLRRGRGTNRVQSQRLPRIGDRHPLRRRRVPDHGGGREVPDRFRSAQAGGHVRRKDPHRPQCSANPVTTQPDPPRQGRDIRTRLRQRQRRHPRRLRRLPRQDRGAAHRSQPALRYPRRTEQLQHPGPGRDATSRRTHAR